MEFSMDLLDGIEGGLDAFEKAIFEHAVRPAARQAALVIYEEAKLRAPDMEGPAPKGVQHGKLKDAIYHAFAPEMSSDTLKVYKVGWNHTKAPHGHLIEFGHLRINVVFRGDDGLLHFTDERLATPVQVAAQPFLRPAFDAKVVEALNKGVARAGFIIQKIIDEGHA